jgi:hypothetical protein
MAKDVGDALIEDLAAPGRWPLVGRSSEISHLQASISGRRGAVIVGPAGVGKTVLATLGAEFARTLKMSVALVAGTEAARPYPFGAFAALLHRDSDLVGPESHADQLRRYMHELPANGPCSSSSTTPTCSTTVRPPSSISSCRRGRPR